jgi:hypothetical protein
MDRIKQIIVLLLIAVLTVLALALIGKFAAGP